MLITPKKKVSNPNNLSFHLKKEIEKEKQTKSRIRRRKGIIKIKVETCVYKLLKWTQEEIESQKR